MSETPLGTSDGVDPLLAPRRVGKLGADGGDLSRPPPSRPDHRQHGRSPRQSCLTPSLDDFRLLADLLSQVRPALHRFLPNPCPDFLRIAGAFGDPPSLGQPPPEKFQAVQVPFDP